MKRENLDVGDLVAILPKVVMMLDRSRQGTPDVLVQCLDRMVFGYVDETSFTGEVPKLYSQLKGVYELAQRGDLDSLNQFKDIYGQHH